MQQLKTQDNHLNSKTTKKCLNVCKTAKKCLNVCKTAKKCLNVCEQVEVQERNKNIFSMSLSEKKCRWKK